MENPTFQFLESFTYSSEAQVFKALLESNGIEVFLRDNHSIDADPLYSNALGGVKIFVRHEDFERAKSVMESVSGNSVSASGKPINCPNCDSENVQLQTSVKGKKAFTAFLLSVLFGLLPFFVKYAYKCKNCGHEFKVSE